MASLLIRHRAWCPVSSRLSRQGNGKRPRAWTTFDVQCDCSPAIYLVNNQKKTFLDVDREVAQGILNDIRKTSRAEKANRSREMLLKTAREIQESLQHEIEKREQLTDKFKEATNNGWIDQTVA